MRPGRFVSLVLYGLVCALLGGLGYRRGVVELVRPLAALRRHMGATEEGHTIDWRGRCETCNNGRDAIDRLTKGLGLGSTYADPERELYRGGPVHRSQEERRP